MALILMGSMSLEDAVKVVGSGRHRLQIEQKMAFHLWPQLGALQ